MRCVLLALMNATYIERTLRTYCDVLKSSYLSVGGFLEQHYTLLDGKHTIKRVPTHNYLVHQGFPSEITGKCD